MPVHHRKKVTCDKHYQNKVFLVFPIEDERRSAVIPRLRDKPPRTSSAGRRTPSRHSANNYDPAASVERHQSAGQRASRASQRSEQGYEGQYSSRGSKTRSSSRSSRRKSAQASQVLFDTPRYLDRVGVA
ncbi:hypothetical protein ANCCAN_23343 [Ancylostoma caninum]|uniref:Uncharacterized protein n=1 Tax=Ancylostoma caninum TaxID=29170 RepID=A0A368FFP3_ANCCA|nr:hypothetical protein ANCCAN_23343 [Ancylostoma caninum]